MNDVIRFIYRFTSNGENSEVRKALSGENSYWFAYILFRRFIKEDTKIVYCNKRFGTYINGEVYDATGIVTKECDWVSWTNYPTGNVKNKIIEERIMF